MQCQFEGDLPGTPDHNKRSTFICSNGASVYRLSKQPKTVLVARDYPQSPDATACSHPTGHGQRSLMPGFVVQCDGSCSTGRCSGRDTRKGPAIIQMSANAAVLGGIFRTAALRCRRLSPPGNRCDDPWSRDAISPHPRSPRLRRPVLSSLSRGAEPGIGAGREPSQGSSPLHLEHPQQKHAPDVFTRPCAGLRAGARAACRCR